MLKKILYLMLSIYSATSTLCVAAPRTWEGLNACNGCNKDQWERLKNTYGCIRCNLDGADFSNLEFVKQPFLPDFDIRGSSLKGANFRNVIIKDAFSAPYSTKRPGIESAANSTFKVIGTGAQAVTIALNDLPGIVGSGLQIAGSGGKCPDLNIACYVGSKQDKTFCGATRISQDFTVAPGEILPKCHVNDTRALEACKKMCAYSFNDPEILSTVSFETMPEDNILEGLYKIAGGNGNCPEIPIECYAGYDIPAQPPTEDSPAQPAFYRQSCGTTTIGSSWQGFGCLGNFNSAKQRCNQVCQAKWQVDSSAHRIVK